MKRFFGVGVSLTTILGMTQSAKAEAIALDFSLTTDATTPSLPSQERDWVRNRATDIALNFEPSPLKSIEPPSEPKPPSIEALPLTSDTPIVGGGEMASPRIQVHRATNTHAAAPLALKEAQEVSATDLFAGDADSLVARAVGSAEGTRTPEGGYTAAFYGHIDPGNGVWNLGSFSYQHGASSPEEADEKQLKRLKTQAGVLKQQAQHKGLQLSLQEELNGIDLANQAPLAALDRGYIDWLHQARQLNMPEDEAVLWARIRSFLNPDTGKWNAPGLGNNVYSISHDQARRQTAIAHAIAAYKRRAEETVQVARTPSLEQMTKPPSAEEESIDLLLNMDLFEQD